MILAKRTGIALSVGMQSESLSCFHSTKLTRKKWQKHQITGRSAALAEDPGLKNYLALRAKALLDDDYLASDLAWMDMQNNTLDFVVGPIETYEDQLYGYKALTPDKSS